MSPTPSNYADLSAVLVKLRANLTPFEVHALYLGALASTSFKLSPLHLLGMIVEDEVVGESLEDANASMGVLAGYWNTLAKERQNGRLGLQPIAISPAPTVPELIAFATQRHREVLWVLRGVDAGSGDALPYGPDGSAALEALGSATALLVKYVEALEREPPTMPAERENTRRALGELTTLVEKTIVDLMDDSDAVRAMAIRARAA